MEELVFFKGILLVDSDYCDVSNNRLHCDSNDSDDNDAPKLKGMDVGDGSTSSSQCLEPKTGPAAEPLQSSVQAHRERPSEATLFVHDPLFNAVGKAPHLDAIIVKQEAGWFQLWEEKR